MKIAVIGANGQLGSDLVAAFSENGDAVCGLTHSNIEISGLASVSYALTGHSASRDREHGSDASCAASANPRKRLHALHKYVGNRIKSPSPQICN